MKTLLTILLLYFGTGFSQAQSQIEKGKSIKNVFAYDLTDYDDGFIFKHSYDPVEEKGEILEKLYETVEVYPIINNQKQNIPILQSYQGRDIADKFLFKYNQNLLGLFFIENEKEYDIYIANLNSTTFKIENILFEQEKGFIFSPHQLENKNTKDVGLLSFKRHIYFDAYEDYQGNFVIELYDAKYKINELLEVEATVIDPIEISKNTRSSYHVIHKGWRRKVHTISLVNTDTTIELKKIPRHEMIKAFRNSAYNFATNTTKDIIHEMDSLIEGDTSIMRFYLKDAHAMETLTDIKFELEFTVLLDHEDEKRVKLWNLGHRNLMFTGKYDKNTGHITCTDTYPYLRIGNQHPLDVIIKHPLWSKKIWEDETSEIHCYEEYEIIPGKYFESYDIHQKFCIRDKQTGKLTRVLEGKKLWDHRIVQNESGAELLLLDLYDSAHEYIPIQEIRSGKTTPFFNKKKYYYKMGLRLADIRFSGSTLSTVARKVSKGLSYHALMYTLYPISTDIGE